MSLRLDRMVFNENIATEDNLFKNRFNRRKSIRCCKDT